MIILNVAINFLGEIFDTSLTPKKTPGIEPINKRITKKIGIFPKLKCKTVPTADITTPKNTEVPATCFGGQLHFLTRTGNIMAPAPEEAI